MASRCDVSSVNIVGRISRSLRRDSYHHLPYVQRGLGTEDKYIHLCFFFFHTLFNKNRNSILGVLLACRTSTTTSERPSDVESREDQIPALGAQLVNDGGLRVLRAEVDVLVGSVGRHPA